MKQLECSQCLSSYRTTDSRQPGQLTYCHSCIMVSQALKAFIYSITSTTNVNSRVAKTWTEQVQSIILPI